MQAPYQILLDVWEGSLEINEAELVNGGVAGVIIRINDTSGVLHKDGGFDKQWAEAANLPIRIPYFVHDPWVSPLDNMDWLLHNMPPDCKVVAIDTELSPARWGVVYPATRLGSEYNTFLNYCKEEYRPKIYTGQWFLEYLTPWPKNIGYWWSQYPYSMYPDWPAGKKWNELPAVSVSWDRLRSLIQASGNAPSNAAACPGQIGTWQCSGDKLILPGSLRVMDVNIHKGTLDDVKNWWEYDTIPVPPPPPVPPTTYPQYRARAGHNPYLHVSPSSTSATSGYLTAGEIVSVDTSIPENEYIHVLDRGWVFAPFMELVTTQLEYITCPTCGGTGKVLAP